MTTGPWIDISVALRNGCVRWPGDVPYELTRIADMQRDGTEYNLSAISMSAHVGTHMDSPLHFLDGAPAMETMPLDATMGPARVIEIQDPSFITVEELESHRIQPGERILFKTINSTRQWVTNEFLQDFVHIPASTARYLADLGIRTVGIDALSVGGYETDGAECHRILMGAGIWIIEWLDLSNVEPGHYELACLPLKLNGAEGSPARAVIRKLPV
jgi:arylformamidase